MSRLGRLVARGALAASVVCAPALQGGAETVNRIIAIVNDEVITEADVAAHVSALFEEQQGSRPSGEDRTGELRGAVLRRLIEQRLMLQEARRQELVADTAEVSRRLERARGRFESEAAFRESLSASGVSMEELKEQIRDQLIVQQLIAREVRSTVTVSPQEVAQAIAARPGLAKAGDRIRASHLLVRVSASRSEEEARALIEQLHRELTEGADFAQLARQRSEDPRAVDGGRMDWVAEGELLPALDAALFRLPPGAVSEPIQTRLGFHLLKVEERRAADSLSLMEAHHAVYEQLYQEKFQAAFGRWLADLTRRAYVEILPRS